MHLGAMGPSVTQEVWKGRKPAEQEEVPEELLGAWSCRREESEVPAGRRQGRGSGPELSPGVQPSGFESKILAPPRQEEHEEEQEGPGG